MPKRLAITISGAVSLGSYEAGVLYEVLQAIAAQNNTATSEDDKIYIDVLTGASAGAMCAAVLAQKLLYDGDALAGVDSNALHDPWIVDVSLDGLLSQPDKDPTKSLFASDLIESISQKYLTKRYQTGLPPVARAPHPAIEPGKPMKFGLALSNLDGVNYSQALLNGDKFTYTRYQDEFRQDISADDACDNLATWEEIRQAAVSSGAFPFAFRVKQLQRKLSDYVGATPDDFPQLNMRFAYTDGGVFQNEPLGLAKNFVDQIDHHLNSDSRFYLFIAPGSKDSSFAGTKPADFVTEDNSNFFAIAKGLSGAIFNQARFHDWIMAEKVNEQVALFNLRATQLQAALINNTAVTSVVGPAADAYLVLLQSADSALTAEVLAQAQNRLSKQFEKEYAALVASPGGQPAADAWLKSILVLELAAELGDADEMNILAVTAKESDLAGTAIAAFGGFFDQKIRQHDYDVGRNKAKEFIAAQNSATSGLRLGPFQYDPGSPVPLDPVYGDGFDISKLSPDERENLKARFCDRIDTLLYEIGVPWILRKPMMTFYVDGKVDEFLKLDGTDNADGAAS